MTLHLWNLKFIAEWIKVLSRVRIQKKIYSPARLRLLFQEQLLRSALKSIQLMVMLETQLKLRETNLSLKLRASIRDIKCLIREGFPSSKKQLKVWPYNNSISKSAWLIILSLQIPLIQETKDQHSNWVRIKGKSCNHSRALINPMRWQEMPHKRKLTLLTQLALK